ncbi:MAG: 3-phosphoshikimate 1-carboxyvinyltransferase [Acidobacteria bacterium]|nr:3-phosphoshikimate 1-carboxyvinyltransferase [Acidobacteriota bacterium]
MWLRPASRLEGTPHLPGDKSISHRYAMLAALCLESTRILNYSPSDDCRRTLSCLESVGARVERTPEGVCITGQTLGAFRPPSGDLDCGNSGTTMRLLSGILAAQKFRSTLTGDASLSARPMGRILVPLRKMGASLACSAGDLPPLQISGRPLHGVEYVLPLASAQVKSCVLLAGLHAAGLTEVVEAIPSRSHTELAFPIFGIDLEVQGERLALRGGQQPRSPGLIRVPADPSAAAFFCVAACLIPGSRIRLEDINFNPARIALFRLLIEAGADIRVDRDREELGEPLASLTVSYSDAFLENLPAKIGGKMIPALIDEIPIMAILGSRMPRGLEIRDASELRHKETDRIHTVALNLKAIGVPVEELEDGIRIHPGEVMHGARLPSYGDHRIAMAFSIAALIADSDTEILDDACVAVSYPDFFSNLERLTGAAGFA